MVFSGNPLKYWEMFEVFGVHEPIMVNITDRKFQGALSACCDFAAHLWLQAMPCGVAFSRQFTASATLPKHVSLSGR